MSNLQESGTWEPGIYQLELDDPVEGGPDGIDNLQAKQLANRTVWLKDQVEQAGTDLAAHEAAIDPHPQYMTPDEGDSRYSAGAHSHASATTSAAGFMSSADKTKLDGLPDGAIPLGQKGVANGVATLDATGKINSNQLPGLAISDTFVVSTQASMLALVAEPGDVCVRTDENKSYILKTSPASTLANWQQLLFPAGGGGTVTSVGITVPTGLSVSGSPVTGSGTIAISLASGYSIPTTAKQTQWDTAYGWGSHTSAGYHVVGGALGTPASGALTNCTVDGTNQIGYRGIPQNSQSTAYTCVLTDAGKHIYESAATTITIPANASVAYPVGTAITFVSGASAVSIAITTDTMRLAGTGTTGTRTLAAYGMATAVKVAATEWRISGAGLS